jgi:hypothetical protein
LSQTLTFVTHLAPECGFVQVVHEGALAVDLDHRQPFPVASLERRVSADVDLLELELELGAQARELPPCPLAQVAARSVVQRDPGYGYSPRVVVASATRWTASP